MPKLPIALIAAAVLAMLLAAGCQSDATVAPPTPAPVIATAPAPVTPASTATPIPSFAGMTGMTVTPPPTAAASAAAPARIGLPTPSPTPAAGRIRLPTPTPTAAAPTATPGPTATPIPTPRPESTAGDRNICRRTPEVQMAIMAYLDLRLCSVITQDELFRITGEGWKSGGYRLDLQNILHPDDLAGLVNLRRLEYRGILDYIDFSHTPALRSIILEEPVKSLPDNFSVAGLPQLEVFGGEFRGAAACRLLERETLRRVFGDVGQWPDSGDFGYPRFSLSLMLPASELPAQSQDGQAWDKWTRGMQAAVLEELGLLDAARSWAEEYLMQQYGPDLQKTFADMYQESSTAELERQRADVFRNYTSNRVRVQVTTSSNLVPCE